MLINPQRAQAELDHTLIKIHATTRMRVGIVAGMVIVGLFHTDFGGRFGIEGYAMATLPVIALSTLGLIVVLVLRLRDIKKARARYESQTFRIPKRKSGS